MRIVGGWSADVPFLVAFLTYERLNIKKRIVFLIDSGASKTTILDGDAIRLGIDYSRLQRHKEGTTGIGGTVDTYIIPDVKLFFKSSEGSIHEEKLKEIFVLKHNLERMKKEETERIKMLPSVLGRDVINRFKLVLCKDDDIALLTDEISV